MGSSLITVAAAQAKKEALLPSQVSEREREREKERERERVRERGMFALPERPFFSPKTVIIVLFYTNLSLFLAHVQLTRRLLMLGPS